MDSLTNICWIRRDLRLDDHVALSEALKDGPTVVAFVFDKNILNALKKKNDQRVSFIYDSLKEIEEELQKYGSSLAIVYGDPSEEIPLLAKKFRAKAVYCNRDYEPYAKDRDKKVEKNLLKEGIQFYQFKDSVIFERQEVLTKTNTTFKVFTPYKNKWIENFETQNKDGQLYQCSKNRFLKWDNPQNILIHNWYGVIGFQPTPPLLPAGRRHALKRLKKFSQVISEYHERRNYLSIDGTSLLSVYIRHGNLSIREMVKLARNERDEGHRSWLSELIWREFYQMILDAHPEVQTRSFKAEFDKITFLGTDKDFQSWCHGKTGFPLIDAAMRCFNETGLMHNRLRMLCASFLCKILLVDWRKGEHYFAENLLDYDLAANNGGWQWSAGCGCDAQPYFRIFNPYTQSKKFDAKGEFIRKWVPELRHLSDKDIHHPNTLIAPAYPTPIVSYESNRMKCLKMYEVVKN